MILDLASWMNIRRFRALHVAGATFAEIGRECGCDWRTVRKYLAEDAPSAPLANPPRAGMQPKLITRFIPLVEGWLRTDIDLKAKVIHERLVTHHGFTGNHQRVKMFVVEAWPRIAAELAEGDDNPLTGLHRRFEVVPGAQAQVDWGQEGDLLGHLGIGWVYSFHMTLSYSRDPFTCFTTSMDLATFWGCHWRAFAHFGWVPGSIVYDRTKTVIKRHVAPKLAVLLHPEAAAFADGQVHRTHSEVIAVRAQADRAALQPLPQRRRNAAARRLWAPASRSSRDRGPAKEPRLFRCASRRGRRSHGRGGAAAKAPVSTWRMTSDQAPVLWPFIATPASPRLGHR
jgi:transposase